MPTPGAFAGFQFLQRSNTERDVRDLPHVAYSLGAVDTNYADFLTVYYQSLETRVAGLCVATHQVLQLQFRFQLWFRQFLVLVLTG